MKKILVVLLVVVLCLVALNATTKTTMEGCISSVDGSEVTFTSFDNGHSYIFFQEEEGDYAVGNTATATFKVADNDRSITSL